MSISQGRGSRAWRFRHCPACGAVRAAGEFEPVYYDIGWEAVGRMLRECPECGHQGPTSSFPIVVDRRGVGR